MLSRKVSGQQDFFAGLPLQPASDARRELPMAGRNGMDAMRQVAEKHRNLQGILARSEHLGRGESQLMGPDCGIDARTR